MSNPTELGDFTLKQLLHLYQISETGHSNSSEKNTSKSELVSAQDIDLFRQLMEGKSESIGSTDQQVKTAQKNNNLTEIFDSLIDDIDSEPSTKQS